MKQVLFPTSYLQLALAHAHDSRVKNEKSSHPFATSSDTSETADRFKFSANEVFSDAE